MDPSAEPPPEARDAERETAYQGLLAHITAMEQQDRIQAWVDDPERTLDPTTWPPTPTSLLTEAMELLRAADAELEQVVDGGYQVGELRDRIDAFLSSVKL